MSEHWSLKGYFLPPCRFGSFVYSNRTGIILNNELADFCIVNRSINPGEHSELQHNTQGQEMENHGRKLGRDYLHTVGTFLFFIFSLS